MKQFSFLLLALLAFWACTQTPPTPKTTFRSKIGLQLYSLRDQAKSNLDSALQFAKDQGLTDVEVAGFAGLTAEQFKAKLDHYGLKASGIGAGMADLRDSLDKVIAHAKLLGCSYVMSAWIDHKADTITLDEIKAAVELYNIAGKKLKDNGLQFCYHTHGYEFVPYGNGTYFDYLYENTDPQNVQFEADIFWITHGGQDPVAFLKKYAPRVPLMHVKDQDKSVTGNLTGHEDVRMDVPWGTGKIDVKACCLTGAQVGVKHFYLEDESPTVLSQIPVSLKFVEGF